MPTCSPFRRSPSPLTNPSYQKKTFANCCCKDRSGGEMRRCLEALNRLTLEGQEESIRRLNTIKGYVYVLLGLMLEESGIQDVSENQNTSLAKDILTYLQEHYQSDLTLDALAQTFGYSKSRFSHLFHEYFGSGFRNTSTTCAVRQPLRRWSGRRSPWWKSPWAWALKAPVPSTAPSSAAMA